MPSPIVIGLVLVALAGALQLMRRSRSRCPYSDPLCRHDRPCVKCYRDLYRSLV